MPTVEFEIYDKKIEVPLRSNLMQAIVSAGLPIGSSCGGVGVCTKCLVEVTSGHDQLSKPNPLEKKLALKENLKENIRVSCQTKVLGDVKVRASYW